LSIEPCTTLTVVLARRRPHRTRQVCCPPLPRERDGGNYITFIVVVRFRGEQARAWHGSGLDNFRAHPRSHTLFVPTMNLASM
jgi:hypothetical protein